MSIDGGESHIAMRIARSDEDPKVKKCLQALFTHELQHAEKTGASFREDYRKAIEKLAAEWTPSEDAEVVE
ncbi:MAG: hypothetical protein Q8M66_09145 [Actinomycetota bacterium]|nr:hypothetical protein [Actinomycetota bacterium]MDZ4179147.1 hypothetical protein [Coriobacteriia bacterium]